MHLLEIEGFTTKEILHEGKKFTIYRGFRNSDDLPVILKVCRFEQPSIDVLSTLQHEYQILRQLNLPGIIRVYDLIQHHFQLILVLEDFGAKSLREYLAQQKISLNAFFEISLQLIDAINSLHMQNIIHKDINPSNILIEPSTLQVKLSDFSISTKLSREMEEPALPENLAGTLHYISPEQTGRMNRFVDYRTDFYSLGITFYEMLTGNVPFESKDPLEIIHGHLAILPATIHEKNPEVPEILSNIIGKLFSKMPEERYASTAGLKQDLLECKTQWLSKHSIEPFTLAKNDITDQFIISQKLYGREKEVKLLLQAFESVSVGSRELLTVSGFSGIGKTSLVHEIYKPILYQRGYIISGKYDQLQRTTPYSAFIEAFDSLVHRLLMESDRELLELKESMLAALENNGQLIVNVIPSFSHIIGKQEPVLELPSAEAQNRFMMTFKNFIRVLGRKEHPLVIFLDDLQWIDNASLQLLKLLLTDQELRYVLIIGAYRNNEVSIDHPLALMIEQLHKLGPTITSLTLGPLKKIDIQQLLSDSLNRDSNAVESLSEILSQKTQGNPFFINEFLKKIYQDRLLVFSYKTRQWQWNINEIENQPITENVVTLLIDRIQKLSENSRNLLTLASAIGHIFDLHTLAIISEQKLTDVAKDIEESLEANFIIPVGEGYRLLDAIILDIIPPTDQKIQFRFIHDRVQQAAYQIIPEEMKKNVHLKIGRLLFKENKDNLINRGDKLLFEILDHFNQGILLITETSEKYELANLNLLAGMKAKNSIAYEAALSYMGSGIKLLEPLLWDKDYSILFNLYRETAECLYFLRKFDEGNNYIEELLARTTDNIQKAEVYLVKIRAYVYSAKHKEAIELGYKALSILNFRIPRKIYTFLVLKEIFLIKWETRKKNNEKFIFENHDARLFTISQILASIFAPAYQLNQNLFAYIVSKLVRNSLKLGYTSDTPFAYLAYGIVLISALNQINDAFYFADLANATSKLLGKHLTNAKNYLVLGIFIVHWKYPLNLALENLEKSHHASIEEGDFAYGNYSQLKCFALYYLGKPLLEVQESAEKSISFLLHTGDQDFYNYFLLLKQVARSLIKKNAESDAIIDNVLKDMSSSNNKTVLAFIYSTYSQFLYIQGDFDKALEIALLAQELKFFIKVTFHEPYQMFFYGLCLASRYRIANQKIKSHYKKELKKIQKQLLQWSQYNPNSFFYLYLLISAEIKQLLNGFTEEAVQLYNQAIREAEENRRIQFVAIANECAARFYNHFNNPLVSKLYLKNAYYAYLKWGALEKCAALKNENPDLAQSITSPDKEISFFSTSQFSPNVDILSIFKAAQVISGEIQLEVLLRKLIHILIENAGAQKGFLLIKEQNDWFVEAEGTTVAQKITLNRTQSVANRTDIPLSLIKYIEKTKEPLLIQTADELEPYVVNDQYLSQVRPKSIVVLPVFYQGILKNLLYLENRDINHAFTQVQIQTLNLLTSQAAISLENARLYHQATHDPLTGFANRNLLYQIFNYALAKAKRAKSMIAILFLDLDQFKKINDTLGHAVGDKVLLIFSEQLKMCLREENLSVRLGGDEFIVMLENTNLAEIRVVAQKIIQRLTEPFIIEKHKLYLSASIGISVYPNDGANIQELLKQADIALYHAKETGRGRYQFFMEELNQKLKDDNAKEIELIQALDKNQLCLYYQPIFEANTHKLLKTEALLRWKHPNGTLLLPQYFLQIAEKSGLILEIGEWVLREVCRQISIWKSQGIENISVAINISGTQVKKQNFEKLIKNFTQEYQIDPSCLELEFTENVLIEHTQRFTLIMHDLKKLGIKLVIDDFGTYYSSLSYLSNFQVDIIKIDRSFIYKIEQNEANRKLIVAIIAMVHSLNYQVIAEGVESEEQLKFLEEAGVDAIQGFYLSIPLSAEDFTLYLQQNQKR